MFKFLLSLLILTSLGPLVVGAETAEFREDNMWARRLEKRLDRAVKKAQLRKSELSLYVSRKGLGPREELFSLNADRSTIPASLTKIVTAAAALDTLGSDHRFITQLVSSAPIHSGVLKGDLILKGKGDPGFVSETMWRLVNHFTRRGVKKVEGRIVVDDSYFDDKRFDSGRDPTRVDRAYDAPVGAMSFNWNSVNIYVAPGRKPGDRALVHLDPESSYVKLINKTKTVPGRVRRVRASREGIEKGREVFVVAGDIGVNRDEVVLYKSITRPALWSGHQLKAFLQRRGVEVTGGVAHGKGEGSVLAEAKSDPLSKSVADMMKFSNNYVAEMLTKHMAVASGAATGNMGAGLKSLSDYLLGLGIKQEDFVIQSPSGLSRENRFRAIDLHKVLTQVYESFNIRPEFLASLPIAGKDGTLKSRMKNSAAQEWLRAKTGMLRGVVGLAGYAGRKNAQVLTFVFVFNGRAKKMVEAKRLFDEMGDLLAQ